MQNQLKFSITRDELKRIVSAFEFWISGKADFDWAIPIWGRESVQNAISFLTKYLSKEVSPVTLIFLKCIDWNEYTGIILDIVTHCDNLPKEYWLLEDMNDRILFMEKNGELPDGWE